MSTVIEEHIDQMWSTQIDLPYAKVLINKQEKIAICQAMEPYIPIDDFMNLFNAIGEIVKLLPIEKLIFDKRKLRAFHQPSMEWYFIFWKAEMMKYGLTKHRKILPDEDWFKKCVEAGRAEIKAAYPDHVVHLLDIRYCNTIKEAVEI